MPVAPVVLRVIGVMTMLTIWVAVEDGLPAVLSVQVVNVT
jgi:hypothetical protein